jgi:hypothetical protein
MENYVVSYGLSEKLKMSKFPQNTQFAYDMDDSEDGSHILVENPGEHPLIIAAPLSDEVLEQLPGSLDINGVFYQRYIYESATGLQCVKYEPVREDILAQEYAESLPDALALMWLYCKEHNLLEDV